MTAIDKLSGLPGGVVVLCGGPGGEREVSLASGDTVHRALRRAGLDNSLVVVPARNPDAFLEKFDCGLAVMMLHGTFGEDGTAQAILERRGIAFTGSDSAACRLAMDKDSTKVKMRQLGVPTPRSVVVKATAGAEAATAGLKYPLFVKPNFGGSSVGVSRVDRPEQLTAAIGKTLEVDRLAMIEEMVVGRELTTGWLNGRVLPIIELNADGVFYDYRAKYVSNETKYICPAVLDGEMKSRIEGYVTKVVQAVGARDLARVDLMLGDAGPMLLELNALPGFTSHSLLPMAAAKSGMPLEDLCLLLASMALERAGVEVR